MEHWILWSLLLLGAGLVLTVIEVVLPSAGLLALAAIACYVGSLLCAYQLGVVPAAILAGVEIICVPAVIVLAFKLLPRTSVGKQLFLSPPSEPAAGAGSEIHPPLGAVGGRYDELLLREGRAVTPLRPSGTADFQGERVSVVTNGQMIDHGARVRCVEVHGNRVVVEAVDE